MTDPTTANQELIKKLTEIILANLEDEKFGVNELVHASGMSLYLLTRRLRSLKRKTVNQFIREVRLQKAYEMLQHEQFTVSEIAYKTGFGSPNYFNKCFHEFYGYSPGKVKNRNSQPDDLNALLQGLNQASLQEAGKRKYFLTWRAILIVTLLSVSVVFIIYSKFAGTFGSSDIIASDGRISVAVLPFHNMTSDSVWNVWQEGIQTCLITSLSNSEGLKVRQLETINTLIQSKGFTNNASITPSVASTIAQKLDANLFMYGSINKSGTTVRLNAQLINSKTEEIFRTFQLDGTSEKIIKLIDSLSVMTKNYLMIFKLGKVGPAVFHNQFVSSTNSPEAFKYFIYGQTAYYKNDYNTARDWFLQALAIDSNLVGAMAKISTSYFNEFRFEEGKEWCRKYYSHLDMMSMQQKIWANFLYALYYKMPNDRIRYLEQLIDIDDRQPITFFQLGDTYLETEQYDKAIIEFEKALEIFKKWGIKPPWVAYYIELGQAYHKSGKFKKEKKLYRKAEKDFPDDPELIDQQAWLALTEGNEKLANQYIEKYISIRKGQSWSEAKILSNVAYIYIMAGMPDKVEEYYRRTLSLEPENPFRLNALAYILIDYEKNVAEGMELVEKVLAKDPDNFASLHAKGWGLYKLGRINEAYEVLQKSWDLRTERSIYNHTAYLHLEEARKTAEGMK